MVKCGLAWLAGIAWALAGAFAQGGERPLSEAIRAAADAVRPSIVGVEVKRQLPQLGQRRDPNEPFVFQWPPRQDPPGQRRFRIPLPVPPGDGQIPQIIPFGEDDLNLPWIGRQPSEGTGLVVAVEGERAFVAVPHALVAGAEAVTVKLSDGRSVGARVAGADPTTGIACLEVRDARLAAAKLAKPEAVQVGDWVLAVGGPEANGALTIGIVSTKRAPGEGELAGTEVFQADINLPQEMAGSPLVDLNGEVVGIAPGSDRRGRQGRGLASVLPADTLQATVAALAKEGRVRRGLLGVMIAPLDPEAMQQLKIDAGIQIPQVVPDSPAAKAGVEAGDVIVELDGKKVANVAAFRAAIAAKKPGTNVSLKLLRAGKEIRADVALGEQEAHGVPAPAAPQAGEKVELGLALQPLTPDLAAQFGFEGDRGLLVTDVAADGLAAKARPVPIARGELVKEIARKPVATVADVKAAVDDARKAKEKTLLVLVRSKEGARYVVVDLPQ